MGCEGVFHLASVVLIPKSDPKAEVLDPAVRGTLNVLQSCKKNPFLKKVVLTSSISAVARPSVYPKEPLDETSWSCAELCEKLKAWYPLSKVLAEQAAWKFAKENNINLVTVIPSFIIGSSLPYNLHTTASNVLSLLKGENETFAWHGRMGYVHIDDVASCHIKVYEDDTAEGRYLCTSTVLEGPELAAFLAKRYPWLPISLSFNDYVQKHPFEYNTSKVQKLGIKFKGIEEMFDDCTIHKAQRAEGTAIIMSIGTVNPPNVVAQNGYADFYFRVTNNEDKIDLKNKFDLICRKTMIKKKYLYHNEELLKKYPNICSFDAPSLNDRRDICIREVPKLGKQATLKALEEWGRDKSLITHLIMCTSSCVDMPSTDVQIAKLLDLRPDVKFYMVYMQGRPWGKPTKPQAGATQGRGETKPRSSFPCLLPSSTNHRQSTRLKRAEEQSAAAVGAAVVTPFALTHDGAAQKHMIERRAKAQQAFLPAIAIIIVVVVWLREESGRRAILDQLKRKLNLQPEKFRAARHVLWEYGNMVSSCVLCILDVMRRRSLAEGLATTGEGLAWGVLLGFGPGVTVETVMLHSIPI
ncbi:uncharacterized protein A4U43_C03F15010 [Asparagus officinalis]|uniref:chalcone synthase n=1 Tax=Asparagus officinalis TaxID=4686 RepID=A0A5P1FEE8_ASPOF|nr:uncharacterized protein A4U43_C03F15010 [Asparagus officinalis]